MAGLNQRQTRFVDEYIRGGNATKAAKLAGYSEASAGQIGGENMKKPMTQSVPTKTLRIPV